VTEWFNWQSNWQEIQVPISGRKGLIASAYWRNKDTIEIRVYDRLSEEILMPGGFWVSAKKYRERRIPVAKLVPAQDLIERGIIEPLKPGVHTTSYFHDGCHTCKISGQEYIRKLREGVDIPCPGWSP
jgi:hypothetical protein